MCRSATVSRPCAIQQARIERYRETRSTPQQIPQAPYQTRASTNKETDQQMDQNPTSTSNPCEPTDGPHEQGMILATRNQLYISRAVARVVIFLPRTLVQNERKIKPCTTVTTIHDLDGPARNAQHMTHTRILTRTNARTLWTVGTNT